MLSMLVVTSHYTRLPSLFEGFAPGRRCELQRPVLKWRNPEAAPIGATHNQTTLHDRIYLSHLEFLITSTVKRQQIRFILETS
jgi:hypothetical protein